MKFAELAKQLLTDNAVFLDTETTGLGSNDEIVEVAVIDSLGKKLLDTLVKPTVKIKPDALLIHGISEVNIVDAPSFGEVLPQLLAVINKRQVVIYNAEYDVRMLAQSARAYGVTVNFGNRVHCAMHMYAEFYGEWDHSHGEYRWHKLEVAARQCGIKLPLCLHRARIDAELTRQIVIFMASGNSCNL